MDKESNLYTFTFAILMVLIVGTALALTSELLQPKKKQNAADKKMIDILSAIGVNVSRSEAESMFNKYITDQTVINNDGQIVDGTAFDIDVLFQHRDKTLTDEEKKYPFFTAMKDNQKYIIVPMAGNGLWGPVWGFVALGNGTHKNIPYVKGDTFKPASWASPAKHVRGNILDGTTNWYDWTGPNYLK